MKAKLVQHVHEGDHVLALALPLVRFGRHVVINGLTVEEAREQRFGQHVDGERLVVRPAVGRGDQVFQLVVFVLDDGVVYHTYSTGARGLEFLMAYYPILDRAPKGRDEDDSSQMWIRRHDEY